jgi:hypothetical protein
VNETMCGRVVALGTEHIMSAMWEPPLRSNLEYQPSNLALG